MDVQTEIIDGNSAVLELHKPLLNEVWQALRLRLVDTGMEEALNVIPRPELASYRRQIDPFDSSETVVGTWHDEHGSQTGEVQIRANGSVYAEVDVIRNLPNDGRWFVEAVTAWGESGNLKSELRLIATV